MTRGVAPGAQQESQARRLLRGVRLGLALLDADGRVEIANRGAETLLGYGEGELAGLPLAALYPPEEQEGAARLLAAARQSGRAEDETWRVRRDGSKVWAGFVVATAADGTGALTVELHEVAGRPAVEAELRQRLDGEREAREKAEEASRARDEFLATLSHELRTPLTAIMGWAHLLRAGNLDEATRARALETIERNAHVEAQLTADILDVARIITGKLRLHIQAAEPDKIVEAALETVRHSAAAKGIDLRLEVEGRPGQVPADPDRLQQAIANLLTNAIKFTPEHGRVGVRLQAMPEAVEIAITDTGEGIGADTLPHVFERFRQGTSLARKKGGLGLGLAIVHHIVELHSGHVEASSDGPGRGATFTIRLPLLTGRAAPAVAPASGIAGGSPTDSTPLADVTVLVVDDQEDARELMCAVLGSCGARVIAFDSTAAALEALDRCRPDVVLSDLEMPGEDGYSLIRKIRERSPERGGTVPAAALTAYARTEDRLRSLQAGFHRHVPKPVQPDELAEIVAALAARGR